MKGEVNQREKVKERNRKRIKRKKGRKTIRKLTVQKVNHSMERQNENTEIETPT